MRTFYIYLMEVKNFNTGLITYDAFAEIEETKNGCNRFLFSCPEQWLPKTKEEFLKACAYYKVQVPENVKWFGYVPF